MSLSPEIEEKLKLYQALLLKWQAKINLISPQTIDQAWQRHFEDSLQLAALVKPEDKILFDFGSGAGFPGLVLATICPHLSVHLFESDQKKCSFLRTVSRETKTPVHVHNARIEDASLAEKPDIITARALAPLADLFDYAEPWMARNQAVRLVFPKGAQAERELNALEQIWDFSLKRTPSRTSTEAEIFEFSRMVPRAVPKVS